MQQLQTSEGCSKRGICYRSLRCRQQGAYPHKQHVNTIPLCEISRPLSLMNSNHEQRIMPVFWDHIGGRSSAASSHEIKHAISEYQKIRRIVQRGKQPTTDTDRRRAHARNTPKYPRQEFQRGLGEGFEKGEREMVSMFCSHTAPRRHASHCQSLNSPLEIQ